MPSRRAFGATLALLALLAGCRTIPVSLPPAASWSLRRAELQARAHFELKGQVAVAAGSEGFNARLRWVQDGARSQVALEGPLGAGGVEVTSEGSALRVVAANGTTLESDAARAELATRLGFEPPIASLRYWILGVPDPAQPAGETLDAGQQRLTRLEQGGWRIDYSSYVVVGSEWRPSRLTLERADVRVRLLVNDWQS